MSNHVNLSETRGKIPVLHQTKSFKSKFDGQRVKTNYTGYSEINSILDDIENTLKEIEREGAFNKKEYTGKQCWWQFLIGSFKVIIAIYQFN